MNESDAKAALRAMGIFAPSRSLVQNWLRAVNADPYVQDERRPIELPPTQPNTTAERNGTVADLPISGVDLDAAIHALEAQGIPTTQQAVLDWLARQGRAHTVPAAEQTQATRTQNKGSSKLARFAGPQSESKRGRKPGRPRIIASWFPAVTKTMADGTTLRTALAINGLSLCANEMRALYRNKTFKGLYQEARRRYLIENWGRSKAPSLRSVLGRCL